MFANQMSYVGIDLTAGARPLTYAALDHRLNVTALGRGEMHEILAFVGGQGQALVGVCAPQRPNQGIMEQPEVRASLNPPPRPGRWADFRLVEYLLRQHRIACYKTPASEAACPAWMQRGFQLYRGLEGLGGQEFPLESRLQWVEVYPHAAFCTMLGHAPFPKTTFEGRLQRQLLLYDQNINLPDPMRVFEEITRHHLLRGVLPVEKLYSAVELDALSAAYCAWMAVNRPNSTLLLGEPSEGRVLLPVAELKPRYE